MTAVYCVQGRGLLADTPNSLPLDSNPPSDQCKTRHCALDCARSERRNCLFCEKLDIVHYTAHDPNVALVSCGYSGSLHARDAYRNQSLNEELGMSRQAPGPHHRSLHSKTRSSKRGLGPAQAQAGTQGEVGSTAEETVCQSSSCSINRVRLYFERHPRRALLSLLRGCRHQLAHGVHLIDTHGQGKPKSGQEGSEQLSSQSVPAA